MSTEPVALVAPPETRAADPPVAGLMSTHLVAITADARLPVALHVMAAERVRHLPVVDGGRCVGLLAEGELARLLLGPVSSSELPPLTVGAVCGPAPPVTPTDRRSAAARAMWRSGVDAALVLDAGRLVGILTTTDLLASLAGPRPSPS